MSDTGDVAIIWNPQLGMADMLIAANDLSTDSGFETAVLLSLFTDRHADDGDDLPDGGNDLRGWWADAVPVIDGDLMGSRLWLLDRSKQMPATLQRAEKYALEALQWFLDDGVAASVVVAASWVGAALLLSVTIQRPAGNAKFSRQYGLNWAAQAAKVA